MLKQNVMPLMHGLHVYAMHTAVRSCILFLIHSCYNTVLPMQARSRKSSQPDVITSKQTVKDPENDNDMEELRKKVSLLSSSMANLSHRLDQLQDELKILKEQSPAGNLSGIDSSTPEKTNIESLRSLSYVEVNRM